MRNVFITHSLLLSFAIFSRGKSSDAGGAQQFFARFASHIEYYVRCMHRCMREVIAFNIGLFCARNMASYKQLRADRHGFPRGHRIRTFAVAGGLKKELRTCKDLKSFSY